MMPALFVGLALACSGLARSAESRQYDMKATFLLNFSQFVEWPAESFSTPQAPLVIGVLGEDPFGRELDDVTSGETVQGHPVAVERYARIEDVRPCHILFISSSEEARIARIMAALRGRNVLTVGDFENFVREGGVIRFVELGDKLRLHINLDAAKAANLDISSKLLRPSYIVSPEKD
jgi:YfiR/HmsC-like